MMNRAMCHLGSKSRLLGYILRFYRFGPQNGWNTTAFNPTFSLRHFWMKISWNSKNFNTPKTHCWNVVVCLVNSHISQEYFCEIFYFPEFQEIHHFCRNVSRRQIIMVWAPYFRPFLIIPRFSRFLRKSRSKMVHFWNVRVSLAKRWVSGGQNVKFRTFY